MTLAELASLCAHHAARTVVRPVREGCADWTLAEDRLEHTRTDFFRVRGFRQGDGRRRLLLEQREQALVVLLVMAPPGETPHLIVSLRNEPGLIGGTNLSSTIQSTPSNYRRDHGGGATPFLDFALGQACEAETLWDSTQFDWGQYYVSKTKRYLIIKTPQALDIPEGFLALDQRLAPLLLRADNLVTNDLRAVLASYLALLQSREGSDKIPASAPQPDLSPIDLTPLALDQFDRSSPLSVFEDDFGVGLGFFEVHSPSREVAHWCQPLLVVSHPLQTTLFEARKQGERVFAITQGTQAGLQGQALWFPARIAGEDDLTGPLTSVSTSAEGGRFYRHAITLSLRPSPRPADYAMDLDGRAVFWVNLDTLSALALCEKTTSLELRLLLSLAMSTQADINPTETP